MSKGLKYLDIPNNLEFNELFDKYPIDKYQAITTDKLAFICYSIIQVSIKYRNDTDELNPFVPLCSSLLKSKIQNYHICKEYLIYSKVIECNEHYISGELSKGFRFTDNYFGKGFKKYEVAGSSFKRSSGSNNYKYQNKLNLRAKHLFKYLEDGNLKLNKPAAIIYLEKARETHLEEISKQPYTQAHELLKNSINDRYDKYLMMVEQFEESCLIHNIDRSGFRFFTSITNLKKELRSFITYDNQQLVSLDFKCSQPYLSLILFNHDFYSSDLGKESVTLRKIHPVLYQHLRSTGDLKKLKQITSKTESLATNILDVQAYRNSIIEEDYYTSLSNVISAETGGSLLTREEAKEQSHYILFGDPNRMNWAAGYKAFRKRYPNVVCVFNLLKSRSYNDLAILLQRIESDLVINKITKQFVKTFPDIPIYTIHDSIITVQDYIKKLVNISNLVAKHHFGIAPKFEFEEWGPSQGFDKIDAIKFSKAEKKLLKKLNVFE